MSEYWMSLPRKFCDICKCWFADNKASIEFHERGKRHKENAAKRIHEIQKKGIKQAKKEKEMATEMAKIEKAALAAYEKDLKKMDGSVESYTDTSTKPSVKVPTHDIRQPKAKTVKSSLETVQKKIEENLQTLGAEKAAKVWYEAVTDEGHKYYWNTETSESSWEPPEDGFVSVEEQNSNEEQNSENSEQIESKAKTEKHELGKNNELISCSMGPQPRVDPYGQWTTVEKAKEPEEYDLQLPKWSQHTVEVVIPIHKEENPLKFKEKVVGKISDDDDSGEVTFKKRKFTGSFKRNARQRTTDDD